SLSVISPICTLIPCVTRSCAADGMRTSAMTSCPTASSCRATCPPIKPVAPVTKYFMERSTPFSQRKLTKRKEELFLLPENEIYLYYYAAMVSRARFFVQMALVECHKCSTTCP